jgi:hypothetical protein
VFVPASQAATASWSFEPSSWDFGARLPEEGRSEPKGFVLTNTGAVSLEPALVTLVSGEESGFAFSSGCKSALAPGHSCEADVTFRATTPGVKTATLEVSERNSLVPRARVALTGIGAAPVLSVEPRTLSFGPTRIGSPAPPPQVVTLTNHGPSDLTISDVSLLPTPADGRPPFALSGLDCWIETVLAPGESCTFSIVFNARAVGTEVGELAITDNAADSPQTVEISGMAESEAPLPGLRVDTRPPFAPVLVHKPARRSKHRGASFAFSPGDPSTSRFQCRLGGGPLVSWCRSPLRYRSLKPGRHLFRVHAVGGDGVPGPVVSYRWRILR